MSNCVSSSSSNETKYVKRNTHRADLGGGKGQARAIVVVEARETQEDTLRRFRAEKANRALVAAKG
jgi:hypothetical protein